MEESGTTKISKTILCVWHTSNQGKTETVRELATLLLSTYPSCRVLYPTVLPYIPPVGDFRLVLEIKGRIIGIESQRDPGTDLQGRLIDLVDTYYCEVVICTCRTRGETVDAVNAVAHSRNFEIIWTSTYQMIAPHHILANQLKAKHLLDLLQTFRRI